MAGQGVTRTSGTGPLFAAAAAASIGDACRKAPLPRDRFLGPLVGSLLPAGYAACARILHPATRNGTDRASWAEVAAWCGTRLTATSAFTDVATSAWEAAGQGPPVGTMPGAAAERLAAALASFTSTPQRSCCWVWNGWGDIPPDPIHEVEWTPEATASGRRYMRYACPVAEVTQRLPRAAFGRFQSPALWWPEDLAWVVATEIDAWSTYVVGTEDLVDRLLATEGLEALRASLDDPFDGVRTPGAPPGPR
jgi:hypothetical protein